MLYITEVQNQLRVEKRMSTEMKTVTWAIGDNGHNQNGKGRREIHREKTC